MDVLRLDMTEAESKVFDSMTPEEQARFVLNQLDEDEKALTSYDIILDEYKSDSLAGRSTEEGVCRQCGCTAADACEHPTYGPCWWMDGTETLCSHCKYENIRNDPATKRPAGVKKPVF
jgi:hypothetical protein